MDLGGFGSEGRRQAPQAVRVGGCWETCSGRWARKLLNGRAYLESLGAVVKLGMGGHGTGRIAGGGVGLAGCAVGESLASSPRSHRSCAAGGQESWRNHVM